MRAGDLSEDKHKWAKFNGFCFSSCPYSLISEWGEVPGFLLLAVKSLPMAFMVIVY